MKPDKNFFVWFQLGYRRSRDTQCKLVTSSVTSKKVLVKAQSIDQAKEFARQGYPRYAKYEICEVSLVNGRKKMNDLITEGQKEKAQRLRKQYPKADPKIDRRFKHNR